MEQKHYKQRKYMNTQQPCILYLALLSVLIPINLKLKNYIKASWNDYIVNK